MRRQGRGPPRVGTPDADCRGMTWLEMANLLFEKSNALSPTGAHLHLDTAAWFRTWTPHQNKIADVAALYFARHRAWPAMEPEACCQLYFRCLFALEICIQNDANEQPPPDSAPGEQDSLQFMLVALWHR